MIEAFWLALADMATSGEGLLLVGGAYFLHWLSAFVPNLFSPVEWSWKQGWHDLCKILLMATILILGSGLADLGAAFFAAKGWDIRDAVDAFSTFALVGAMSLGFVFHLGKAINNGVAFLKLKWSERQGDKEQFNQSQQATIENVKQVVNGVYQFFTQSKEDVEERKHIEEIGGRGAYYNVPINSYDAFRATVLGKGYDLDNAYGYQCWDGAALVWQQLGRNLITGNGAASGCWNLKRDVNAGNDFDLIWNLNDVKRGDIVVFGAGQYGHIGFADANYNGSGVISVLGQNQGGSPKGAAGGAGFNVVNVNGASFLGAFRLKKWATGNTAPANPLKDLNAIAQEVRDGKWGNDPERRQRLTAAGYDAAAVQSIVNALEKPKVAPPAPAKKVAVKEGDTVVPTKLIDYSGRTLVQFFPNYTLKQLKGDRAVLYHGDACFAAMNVANVKKA